MIVKDSMPMTGISADDYETLVLHLAEQITARMVACDDVIHHSNHRNAIDALANTWQSDLTAREWLAIAGSRIGVDTSDCVGV